MCYSELQVTHNVQSTTLLVFDILTSYQLKFLHLHMHTHGEKALIKCINMSTLQDVLLVS